MSVIVKGMEMPKTCSECEWCRYDMAHPLCNRVYRRTDLEIAVSGRADFCPLTELPPHGRLIDADEFERAFNEHLLPILIKKYGEDEALKGLHFSFRDCICNIQCQKTVIEAEGSET